MNESHAKIIVESYYKWTKQHLLELDSRRPLLEQLDEAPFAILSHGIEDDPILNYGNQFTLRLWEMDFEQLCKTPSRLTAEPMAREARAKFMQQVTEQGYVSNYTGIRISQSQRRFYIKQATVFNLVDEFGKVVGQAATFKTYEYI